jgi:hypothetical protein
MLQSVCLPVAAQETAADAKAHFQRGLELVDAARYEDAGVEFETAYSLNPRPAVLYNIGMAYVAARRHSLALKTFTRYLQSNEGMASERAANVQRQLESLRREVATVAVTLRPSDAKLEIDGAPVEDPHAIVLDAGTHHLRAHRMGHHDIERTLTTRSGQQLALELSLEQAPVAAPEACEPAPATTAEATRAAERRLAASFTAEVARDLRRSKSERARLVASTAAGAVVLAGVATALFFDNRSRYDAWRTEQDALDRLWLTASPGTEPAQRQAANDARANRIKVQDEVTVGVGIAGAACLVVAAVAWLWPERQAPRALSVALNARAHHSDLQVSW